MCEEATRVDNVKKETSPAKSSRQYLPKEKTHQIWYRDGGKCSFVFSNGGRCGAKAMLEIDHLIPVCLGGDNSLGNLRLLCINCNQSQAGILLGAQFMERKVSLAQMRSAKMRSAKTIKVE